jgi:hypothetical protein
MTKVIDDETVQHQIEAASKEADKNMRLAWRRKEKKMEDLLGELEPLNQEALDTVLKKQPILDEITDLRSKMVHECVHPARTLVHKGDHIQCKFCNKKL